MCGMKAKSDQPIKHARSYSVSECRKAATTNDQDVIDYQHGLMITWLCDEVERLERENVQLKTNAVAPVPKEKLLRFGSGNLVGSLFLSAFAKTFKNAGCDPKCKPLVDATELQLVLVANGIPMDAAAVCVEWESQVDRMVRKQASDMLLDKFGEQREKLFNLIESMGESLRDQLREAGFPTGEDE